MDDRSAKLGFTPQKEIFYNRLLPYTESIDQETVNQLQDIKANLGRAVQMRDIHVGCTHWTGQLTKYIRLHGLAFSKEDHLCFIRILFELITIPELETSLVAKFAVLLTSLLKKRELLSREDLVLPWRPLYKLLQSILFSRYEHHGLQLFPSNIENTLKVLVRKCRLYFPPESTQEMLDEWRPLLCPFDVEILRGMGYFDLFLPTMLPPEQYHLGFKLWFDEFMGLYLACQSSPTWETNLVSLFARLAHDTIGYIDWNKYMPEIFTRILRSLNLPVGTGGVHILHGLMSKSYDTDTLAWWIVSMMGGGSSCYSHLCKLFSALESFYHPSNSGRWNNKLLHLMSKLSENLVRRLHRERYKKPSWLMTVPDSHKLREEEITQFVQTLKPVVFLAMFSKSGCQDAAATFKHLSMLRPELIIPSLLERTYPALETLTEPHRLIACLQCIVAVGRSMVSNPKWFPEGPSHVLPLLNLCLPGLDTNDIKKCLVTFQLISTLGSLVPIVDCSEAVHCRSDLSEVERELCLASAQFEDFIMLFMDRVLSLIESSAQQHSHMDSNLNFKLSPEEAVMEVGLLSTYSAIMQQCSKQIYRASVDRLFRFVSSSVIEIKVAGRYTAHLLRATSKVDAEYTLKKFLPFLCDNLKRRCSSSSVAKEEQLDDEILWNLKLLSEVVRCNGQALVPYQTDLIAVLSKTVHVKCKEGSELSGSLLKYLLKALTSTYALEYRSVAGGWNKDLREYLPIRDWGCSGNLHDLDCSWHIPSTEEKEFARKLLQEFLLPELESLNQFIAGKSMTREQLLQSLNLIIKCVGGASCMLPVWEGEQLSFVESLVELKRFSNIASTDSEGISLDGKNVRRMIADTIRPLLKHMLATCEDDTKGLLQLIKVYYAVLYYHGTQKEDFDERWKSLRIVKKTLANSLIGNKKHIRGLLVDRIELQHEMRVLNKHNKVYTTLHRDMFADLFSLCISRYSEVRKKAQSVLGHGFKTFSYSYRSLLDDVLKYLKNDPEIEHHQFKGSLYIVLGQGSRCLATKRSWEVMNKVWPALLQAQHSEKPSILKVIDDIITTVHKHSATTQLVLQTPDTCTDVTLPLWTSEPKPSLPSASQTELSEGKNYENSCNIKNQKLYDELVKTFVEMIESGTLRWKFSQMTMEMLELLIRYDYRLPAPAVQLFAKNMINDSLKVRKICLNAVSAILKQQKRKHPTVDVDPYDLSGCARPTNSNEVHPGDRRDSTWHHYNGEDKPDTQEKWDKCVMIEKTHWGYYSWPSPMKAYSALSLQPKLDRKREELSEEEQPLYDQFSDADFVSKLLGYLSLEENKGKDKFKSKHFVLFKGLFRNYGDTFLELFKPHVERLVADTVPGSHDSSQRCAAEVIAGVIRGSKHWSFEKTSAMWAWLQQNLRVAISNMTVETVTDWGTCFATASESRDPRKLHWMLDLLTEDPLGADGGSFGSASRLYILQGAIAQQEWRVPQLLSGLLHYLEPFIQHTYKNVRDRLGSVLTNLFLYDILLPNGCVTSSPQRKPFVERILPQLQILKEANGFTGQEASPSKPAQAVSAMVSNNLNHKLSDRCEGVRSPPHKRSDVIVPMEESDNVNLDSEENQEKKAAIRLLKTVMKWLQGSFTRGLHPAPPEIFSFLPILCLLESDTQDEELRSDCTLTLALMSQTQLKPDIVPIVINTIKEVASLNSWHARAAIMKFTQVTVFSNFFILQAPAVKDELRDLVLKLLCDEQVEVREMAAMTLGGFLHCGYLKMNDEMMTQFERLSSTPINKKRRRQQEPLSVESLIRRHAGVLGLSACIEAFPYDVPSFIPQILMDLSDHLDDPQPIQLTVKKTLSNFRRTHHDNWQDHKQKFTDDQLVILTDLLVSPSYYA